MGRKNEKSVIICLLEVARIGARFGMAAPLLVQFEREIEKDEKRNLERILSVNEGTEADNEDNDDDYDDDDETEEEEIDYGPKPQVVTNDLKSLDEMVSKYCIVGNAGPNTGFRAALVIIK